MYYLDYELKLQFVMSALLENFKVHIHAKTKSESSAVNITDFIHNEYVCISDEPEPEFSSSSRTEL